MEIRLDQSVRQLGHLHFLTLKKETFLDVNLLFITEEQPVFNDPLEIPAVIEQ